jgi:F0F1-type ATP synthase alpha subunit
MLETEFNTTRKLVRFTPCLYLLVGKRRSEVIRIQNVLVKNNAFHYTCIIYAGCDMKAGLLYIAPFAVTAMGE